MAVLQGCSGTHQDPRISMCRELAANFSNQQSDNWLADKVKIVEPEYAKVGVKNNSGDSAFCFYEYDTVEENAMTHSEPLLAYATLPYKIIINGDKVNPRTLQEAVKGNQINTAKAVIDHAQNMVDDVNKKMEKSMERINDAIQP